MSDKNLIGIGLYTPAEAGRLLEVPSTKIIRWLRGYGAGNRKYERLWTPQIDLNDGRIYLGFRDLMEVRIASKFIYFGISPQRVRMAIQIASEIMGDARPLSTDRFRTDGRDIFLKTVEVNEGGQEREQLLNLFKRQYEFDKIIEPLLKTVEFDNHGAPSTWWPLGKQKLILVDPHRAFGQPIDAASSVPTSILAAAAKQEGINGAAAAFEVARSSIRRAVNFEAKMELQLAA